jgi:hypothetical protein
MYLRLADAEQGLLISEVDFNIPTLKIGFDDFAWLHCRIRADEISRIAIQQFRTYAQTVGEGRDDDQLKSLMGAELDNFDSEAIHFIEV